MSTSAAERQPAATSSTGPVGRGPAAPVPGNAALALTLDPGTRPHRPAAGRAAVAAALAALALAALVLGLLAAGGAPRAAPAGLPDAGPATGWALPASRLLGHLAVLAVVAALLAPLLARTASTRSRLLVAGGLTWAAAAGAQVLLGAADVTGRPLREALDAALLADYVGQLQVGQALLVQAAAGVVVAAAAALVRRPRESAVLLGLVLLALLPQLRSGHAATAADHGLAVWSVTTHVLGAVLWVGGLAALALVPHDRLAEAAHRFSPLALGCFLLVLASGVLGAWVRLPGPDALLTTGYGALLLAKSALLAALAAVGMRHRRRALPALSVGRAGFARLAVAEGAVMAAALGLATALSRTPL